MNERKEKLVMRGVISAGGGRWKSRVFRGCCDHLQWMVGLIDTIQWNSVE
jgi:hypothetical protein